MSGSKDGAFLNDAKAVAGVDAFGNVHVLNTDVTGTLEVTLTNEPTIDIGKVDQGLPNAGGVDSWPVVISAYVLAIGHWRNTFSSSITPIIILPVSVPRKQVVICNRSIANLYISFDSTLDLTHFDVVIPRNGYYESPPYLIFGDWYGVWDSVDGFATVSSLY
jgi:hypothetical protein